MRGDWVLAGAGHAPLDFAGSVETLDLEVEPSATLTGRVSAVGELDRLASLRLRLEHIDGESSPRRASLWRAREYTLGGFRAGRYRYQVTRQERSSDPVTTYARGEVTLTGAVTTVLDLVLEAEQAPADG